MLHRCRQLPIRLDELQQLVSRSRFHAEILDEDVDLLREIISNDDNLTYGNIISVVTGDDESTSALTDDGVDELRQMLSDARRSAETWQEFLDCFVLDEEIAARVKTYSPR